ncbi:MAG: hypothetical protein PWR09_812 [Archaeoglobi archaeon]|nr:hypothetical protein [Archaeoglobi archaeon]
MMRRFSSLTLAVIVLIALSGCTSQNLQLGKPEIRGVSYSFGNVTDEYTEIKTLIDVYNPNPVPIPLKDVKTEIYMNGIKMGEGSAERSEISANSLSQIVLSTKIENEKIPKWWVSHLKNGEKSEVVMKANLIFDLKLFEFSYPIEKREEIETNLLSKFSIDSPQKIRAGPLSFTLKSLSASWGEITNETSEIILKARIENENPFDIMIGFEGNLTMNGIEVAEGGSDELIVLPAQKETEVEMKIVINNALLDDWWSSHIRNGERTTLSLMLSLLFEYGGKEYRFNVKAMSSELRTSFIG